MSQNDRLVSPTLAQLYMAQGHRTRARETVEALLAEDPSQGVALVLRERLNSTIDAVVSTGEATVEASELAMEAKRDAIMAKTEAINAQAEVDSLRAESQK